MSSSFSDLLRLEKQADGENSSTWGQLLNTVLEMIEDAIAGRGVVDFATDANHTLTVNNSATDEARMAILHLTSTGSLSATRDLIVPTSSKKYIVKNATTGGQSIQVKTSAGTGITIANGETRIVYCDGTNVADPLGFAQSGIADSVATTVEAKLQDMPASPEDAPVPSDGTDATAKLNALLAREWVQLAAAASYTSTTGEVNIRNKLEGSPGGTLECTAAAASYDFAVSEDGAVLRDVVISSVGVQALIGNSGVTDVELHNPRITNRPGSSGHHGLYLNAAGIGGWKLISGEIDADGYACVIDSAVDGSGFVVMGAKLTSQYSDALEINTPTNSIKDGVVLGNILTTTTTGSASGSGFPVGIASGQNWSFMGNAIPQARREAFHVEDGVKTLSFVGNVARDAKRDGLVIIPDSAGEARGIVFVAQNLEADSSVASMVGMLHAVQPSSGAKSVSSITLSGQVATVTTGAAHGFYTGMQCTVAGADQTEYNVAGLIDVTGPTTFDYYVNGSPATPATGTITATGGVYYTPAHVMVANRVKDFDIGVTPGPGFVICDKNVLEEATTASIRGANSVLIGENLASQQVGRPAALVTWDGSGGFYGKIYSDKTPTAVMTRTTTGLPGVLRGFCFPGTPYVHAGGTTDNVPLVALPDLAKGRIRVRLQSRVSGADFAYVSADIHWDGTTLQVTNALRRNNTGVGGGTTFSHGSGNLIVPVFFASASVFYSIVDFDGEWVKY